MKRTPAAAAAFLTIGIIAGAAASAEPILYSFTALPGTVDTCKWFDDNLNDRGLDALTRQTDLLYNRIALAPDVDVNPGATATTNAGAQLVDFKLGSKTVCSSAEVLNGTTPVPSTAPTPLPT